MDHKGTKSKKIVDKSNKVINEDPVLRYIEISVSESEKRTNGTLNFREFYTVYLIETRVTDQELLSKFPKVSAVWRRYTEFEQLRDYLEVTYPYIILPPLPEKRVMFAWQKISSDTFDPNFIDRRRAGLENFLLRIASHPTLGWDKHFVDFLQHEDDWREAHKANGYLHLVETKLSAINVAIRLRHCNKSFETVKDYSYTFQTNLNNLLKTRSRITERQYNIHKLHANYGRVFSEWSVAEKEMADYLQRTGHYLDTLASCVDAALEDEELLADQLKEYLFFAHSLQTVCKNYEYLQLQVESAEDNVASKNVERNKAQQGKISFMSRVFGIVDTEEVRELKVNLLDQQIQEGATAVATAKTNLNEFSTKALKEIERFQNDKVVDLKDTFSKYAMLQLKTAKKDLQTWINIRDCLQNM